MHNLFTKVLYQKRRFTGMWFVALSALMLLLMMIFPTFQKTNIGQTLSGLSPSLQKVVGNAATFTTVSGYISQEVFSLRVPLLLTILTILLFTGQTVGDERKGILETQLSLPLSRSKVLVQKLLACIVITAIAAIGIFVGIKLGLLFTGNHYGSIDLLKELLGGVLISLDFGLLTFLLGAGLGSRSLAIGLSSGYAFCSYLISSLVASVPWMRGPERFSLFHYYQNPSALNSTDFSVVIVVGIILCSIGFILFNRRDIRT